MKNKQIYIVAGTIIAVSGMAYFAIPWIRRRKDIELEKIEGNSEFVDTLDNGNYGYVITNPANDDYGAVPPPPKTAHFDISEYNSKDGTPVPPELYGNLQTLMNQMEVVRHYFGDKPVFINSGYRSPAHNKAVGGVTDSQHPKAKANDFKIPGYTPVQIKAGLEKLIAEGKILPGGIGLYPTFVHYDIRGVNNRW